MTRTTAELPFTLIDPPAGEFTVFNLVDDATDIAAKLTAETARRGGRTYYETFQRADGKHLVACVDPLDEVCFYVPAAWAKGL